MRDSDPIGLTEHLINMCNDKNLAFVELCETFSLEGKDASMRKKFFENLENKNFRSMFKKNFKNTWITNFDMT